jgi:hypothetical protein
VGLFALAALVVVLPLWLAAAALATAAMNHAVSRVHLGEKVTIREAYQTIWRRGWRYIWLYLLRGLVVWGVPAAVWTVLVLLAALQAAVAGTKGHGAAANLFLGLSIFLIFALFAAYVAWMQIRLALAFPACVVEQIGAWTAVKRSAALGKGTRGRILLVYVLGGALNWLLSMGFIVPLTILLYLIPGVDRPQHSQALGMAVLFILYGSYFLVQMLTRPVYGIALALFYYDQRIRLEGYDIEWMMQKAGLTTVAPTEAEGAPWLPTEPRKPQGVPTVEATASHAASWRVTMTDNLRPMNLGEILDRTFQIYRAKFFVFVGIATFPSLVLIGLEAANRLWWGMVPYPYNGRFFLTLGQWTVYSAVLYQLALLLHLLVWPAYVFLASGLYLGERSALTVTAMRGNARWRSWFWMAIASWGLMLILPEIAFLLPLIGFDYLLTEILKVGENAESWLMPKMLISAFLVGLLVFTWLSSALFPAIPIKSLEKLTVGKSLRRSWAFSIGSRWKTTFLRLMLVITSWVMNLTLSWILTLSIWWIIRTFRIWLLYYRNIYTGIGFFSAFIASTVIAPIFPIALTLIYYDQRIRLEGFDIERMMQAAGMNLPESAVEESATVLAGAGEGAA